MARLSLLILLAIGVSVPALALKCHVGSNGNYALKDCGFPRYGFTMHCVTRWNDMDELGAFQPHRAECQQHAYAIRQECMKIWLRYPTLDDEGEYNGPWQVSKYCREDGCNDPNKGVCDAGQYIKNN